MYRESTCILQLLIARSKVLLLIAHESHVVGSLSRQLTSSFASSVYRPIMPDTKPSEHTLFCLGGRFHSRRCGKCLWCRDHCLKQHSVYGKSLNLGSAPSQITAEGRMAVNVILYVELSAG